MRLEFTTIQIDLYRISAMFRATLHLLYPTKIYKRKKQDENKMLFCLGLFIL
jgi:hypothetical protein